MQERARSGRNCRLVHGRKKIVAKRCFEPSRRSNAIAMAGSCEEQKQPTAAVFHIAVWNRVLRVQVITPSRSSLACKIPAKSCSSRPGHRKNDETENRSAAGIGGRSHRLPLQRGSPGLRGRAFQTRRANVGQLPRHELSAPDPRLLDDAISTAIRPLARSVDAHR